MTPAMPRIFSSSAITMIPSSRVIGAGWKSSQARSPCRERRTVMPPAMASASKTWVGCPSSRLAMLVASTQGFTDCISAAISGCRTSVGQSAAPGPASISVAV